MAMSIRTRHRRLLAHSREEDGFALAVVLGSMLVLTIFSVAALTFVIRQIPQSRGTQDYQAAIAASQAGVDDYLSRLNDCDSYWTRGVSGQESSCAAASSPDSALQTSYEATKGQTIPISDGQTLPSSYNYQVLHTPDLPDDPGLLRVRVTGTANQGKKASRRTLTVDLRKDGLLKYIYFTDLETRDPNLYPIVHPANEPFPTNPFKASNGSVYFWDSPTVADAQVCVTSGSSSNYHHSGRSTYQRPATLASYDNNKKDWVRTTTTTKIATNCDEIQFGGGDTLRGSLHTNDSFLLGSTPTFIAIRPDDAVESSWSDTAAVKPSATGRWWGSGTPSTSCGSGTTCLIPKYAPPVALPPDNTQLVAYADPDTSGGRGCLYTGPTKITFRSDGKLDVVSPSSSGTTLPANCGTSAGFAGGAKQTVNGPQNGVLYVQSLSGTKPCPSTVLGGKNGIGYPVTGDVTTYECNDGDAFVSGQVSGKYTLGATNDVNIIGSTTYVHGSGTSSPDVLGLIANGYVQIYHPVNSSGNNLTSAFVMPDGTKGVEVDAAVLSVRGSFMVQNFNKGAAMGNLRVIGSLAQKYRGTVASGDCAVNNGYCKDYRYDSRLRAMPPPYFLDPVRAKWSVVNVGEQKSLKVTS